MARGWESKSVEDQIEARQSKKAEASRPQLTPEEIARQREREKIELSRTRILHDLASATNPRYRAMLEAALAHLEQQLKAFERR